MRKIVAAVGMMCLLAGPAAIAGRANTPIDPETMVGSASTEYDTPPRLVKGKRPVYPVRRALSGQGGSAEICFTIGVDGKASDFEVLRTDHPAFADHAIIAVRSWVFSPAQKDGKAVAMRVTQVFDFDPGR